MPVAAETPAVNVAAPTFKANPWPVCAELRAKQPVVRVPLPGGLRAGYLITRYEDGLRVLRDDEHFVKDIRRARDPRHLGQPWIPPLLRPLSHTMLDSDGAEHRRLRTLVRDTFAPHYIAQLEPRVQVVTDELLSRLARRGHVELVAEFAIPLPMTLIAEILGVPERDRLRFRRWFSSLVELSASERPGLVVLLKLPQVILIMRFLRRLIAGRRARPRDDLISRLVNIRDGTDRLGPDELLAMVAILLIAGYETTVNLIGTGTLLLLQHPDQFARLRNDPQLIGHAVEELLRLATPIDVATERYARVDVEVSGVTIPRGSLVMVAVVSANADERRFAEPDQLDIGRQDNHHLSFGHGAHYCLGAPLARLEGRIAIGSLVQRFPNLRLSVSPDQLRWRPGVSLRGLMSLPVAVSA
jgi:cytochrome P450